MNLLDRYILRSALFSCLASVAVFVFVLMLGNFVRDLLGRVLAGQIETGMVLWLIFLLLPFVACYALPMGVLTGILLTLGRLSADGEITAMRAAGVGTARIARPVLILGLVGGLAALYFNFVSMPWARVVYDRDLSAAARANPMKLVVEKTFIRDFPGRVLYFGERRGSQLKDCWAWELDAQQRVVRLDRAASGLLDYRPDDNSLVLTLVDAQEQTPDPASKDPEDFSAAPRVSTQGTLHLYLPLNRFFSAVGGRRKAQWMTYAELRDARERILGAPAGGAGLAGWDLDLVEPPRGLKELRHAAMKLSFTVQDKFNTSLAVLSFALIGVPLGIRVSRRETTANLGVAVALALGYYFLTVMVSWLDQHPEYRPDLLVWLPNVVFLGLGAWLFRRMDRT